MAGSTHPLVPSTRGQTTARQRGREAPGVENGAVHEKKKTERRWRENPLRNGSGYV